MTRTVLHIGGDPAEHVLVRRLLAAEDLEVVFALDARDGLRLAQRVKPDLVLLDVDPQHEEDYETAVRLRRMDVLEHIPLISLCEKGEARELALTLGCDGSLEKPIDPTRFARRLNQFLRGRRERVRTTVQRRRLEAYSHSLVDRLEHKINELTEANEGLQRADTLKNQLLSNVSRELATPLTPLVGYLALLESGRLGPLSPRQRRVVVALTHGLRRLARTVDQVLDLAALEDAGTVERARFDLNDLVREARRGMEAKARSRRIRIDLALPKTAVVVEGDRGRLLQAVLHIMDHAVRYSPRGGYVLVEVAAHPDRADVAVYDSGDPIPSADQRSLFEPFAGAGRSSVDVVNAPVLALALARRIAAAHGGVVTVESPPRHHPSTEHDYPGAKFVLALPATLTEPSGGH